jgi:hypothetical protein
MFFGLLMFAMLGPPPIQLNPSVWPVCVDGAGLDAYERLDPTDFTGNDVGIEPGAILTVLIPEPLAFIFQQDPATQELLIWYNRPGAVGMYPLEYTITQDGVTYGPGIFDVHIWVQPRAEPDALTLYLPPGVCGSHTFTFRGSRLTANDTFAGGAPNPRLPIFYPFIRYLDGTDLFEFDYVPGGPSRFVYFISEDLYCTSPAAEVEIVVRPAAPADFNADGQVTSADIFDFLEAWMGSH